MTRQELKDTLLKRPGYISGWSVSKIADRFDMHVPVVKQIVSEVKAELQHKYTASRVQQSLNPDNVLIIGDLHEPFCLKEYREFCKKQQLKYNCGTVIFIGDVIDNHYTSYHETESCAMGADQELSLAKRKIASWHKTFPNATVIIGNHDRMAFRKARTAGISSKWVRGYAEVLDTPGWDFVEDLEINGVLYNHGEGGTARSKMKDEHQSCVQGHIHSQAYVDWSVGATYRTFGMQVGCGVDRKSYAMAYGKSFKKPVISCGVVLEKGTFPIVIPMNL
jgi:metallophosphoesterase superfamily enzyme